ncbi:carboxypeptidase-like regulatory domain-containing protein [Aequorivita echinoideorum]|uniref:Carboxypeptidase-like regulatory domain-containing protein n=1 Tax=Aequorivita echinoideorum TaxID=1549647 RepID=A0ABS5S5T5_9FLAO|nr:carboxypeptidase-like regulatory domain-containing protein [Aequorivita echinoideorum]MBT0608563.1 carboxypeptidase-like regulatory domain-containing protein [Aequorivita echinoideorum]
MKKICFAFCLLLVELGFSQDISGKIVDAKTSEPIPFVTIQYGKNEGVVSNTEGNFSFYAAQSQGDVELTTSAMGYLSQTVTLKKLREKNHIIRLSEALNQLSTVYVSNQRPNADSIMQRVRKNLPSNYISGNTKYKLFKRQSSFFKPSSVEIEIEKSTGFNKSQLQQSNQQLQKLSNDVTNRPPAQRYIDMLCNLYNQDSENQKIEIIKATKLLDINNKVSFENIQKKASTIILRHLDTTKTYKLKSGLFTLEEKMSLTETNQIKEEIEEDQKIIPADVRKKMAQTIQEFMFDSPEKMDFITEPKYYEYELDEISDFNGNLVYVVSFIPDRRKAKYEGKIYISNEDYAILKIEYSFAEGKSGEKLNLKFLLGIKYAEDIQSGTIIYTKNEKLNSYFPKYINQESGSYIYVHRPLKFIENNASEKNKVAFDFMIEGHVMEKNELLLLETTALDTSEFQVFSEAPTDEYQLLNAYDASIWTNINTLEPLKEMREFKVE